jgi:hypothetical protein
MLAKGVDGEKNLAEKQYKDMIRRQRLGSGAGRTGAVYDVTTGPKNGDIDPASKISASYRYGGLGAQGEAERYQGMGGPREAIQADESQTWQDRALGAASRGTQQQGVALAKQAALGQGYSAGQAQLRAGTQAAGNAAMALGASARGGPAALAAAKLRSAAAVGESNAMGDQQSAILRAQEMQQGQRDYMGATSALRQGDLSQQSNEAQLAAQQAQLALGSRAADDSLDAAYETMGNRVQAQALGASKNLVGRMGQYDALSRGLELDQMKRDTIGLGAGMSAAGSIAGASLPLVKSMTEQINPPPTHNGWTYTGKR